MNTIDLKDILMHQIAGINDKTFLTAIHTIVEAKSNSIVYKTTPEQRKCIEEGLIQIANGEYFTNDLVEKEIDKWLKEK
jgi:predicted transcriptional regulator